MMDGAFPLASLVIATVLLSLASRRWRTTMVPWGVAPVFVGAATGVGIWPTLGLALLVVALETAGRARALRDVLPVVAVTAPLAGASAADLPTTVIRLMAMTAAVLLLGFGVRAIARPSSRRVVHGPWTELATGLLLLASATLFAAGLATGLPLLVILGMFTPALFPALLEDAVTEAEARGRVGGLVAGAGSFSHALSAARTSRPEALAEVLHAAFQPYLDHQATVIALAPAFGAGSSVVVGCHPATPESLPRVRERARHALQSGRRDSLLNVKITTLEEKDHLHPDHAHQVLIPIRRGQQLLGLLALLGDRPLLPRDLEDEFAGAAASMLERLLERRDLEDRVDFLTQRAHDQGERLRQLLRLGQVVGSTSDPKRVTENLTRTVCDVFGFGRCELLLDAPDGEIARRVAAWGNGHSGWLGQAGGQMSSTALQAALSLGAPMSRGVVVPADAWPTPELVPRDVGHLLVLGLGSNERRIGHLVAVPSVETALPDLNDLRVLEILVEQVTPALASTLQVEELHRQALIDDLTAISNRRGLDLRLSRALVEAADGVHRLALAMIDADDFKSVNDRFGHRIGDEVLRELAQLLATSLRALDFVARYGGEEFCVVLPGLGADQALAVLERLRSTIAEHGFARAELSHPLTLTVSIGLAVYPEDGTSSETLLERADAALYRAKAHGKNVVIRGAEPLTDDPPESEDPFPL